jgi:hypothetical protein
MHSGIFSWDAFSKWEAEAHALIGDFPTYQTTEPSIEAYVKALVADSYRYPKPDGSTLADSYTAYITSLSMLIRQDNQNCDVLEVPSSNRIGAVANRRFCVTRGDITASSWAVTCLSCCGGMSLIVCTFVLATAMSTVSSRAKR